MIDDDDDKPLLLSGAEQTPAPPAKPSSPSGETTIYLQLKVPAGAAELVHGLAQHGLANAGGLVGALLGAVAPAAKAAKPKGSSPEAQALAAGLLRGLGEKYQDPELSKAGQFLHRTSHGIDPAQARQGIFTAAVATTTRPPPKPARTRKPRAARNGKGKRKGR